MSINPNSPLYAVRDTDTGAAVMDVDINKANFDAGRQSGTARAVVVAGRVNSDGSVSSTGDSTYQLASNQPVTSNSGSTPVTKINGGSYIFDAQFTGTSIQLQTLGADGTTWRTLATLNSSGSTGVVLGGNSTARLYNPNGTNLTGVYASLT